MVEHNDVSGVSDVVGEPAETHSFTGGSSMLSFGGG